MFKGIFGNIMEPLAIKKYPDKLLRKQCQPIEKVTEKEIKLFTDMLFTMKYFAGIGLAAPQIGFSERLIVAEVEGDIIKLANPVILKAKGADNMKEGCLSLPDLGVDIERSYEVIIKGLNENGQIVEIKAKGLLARVLQHEIDHLDGKLIVDYLPFWEKLKFRIKVKR